ncbi:MAG: beta-ketoacyl-[acyl-carrier-protein] synthase family protein [Candidatus Omnitrophica bacterium]|nr:beta-ketoacyl-[acyl-carrier-protein] synthase family protein [Candidatus Omnitrophota bacterium]
MPDKEAVISGVGVVVPGALGKDAFWALQAEGKDCASLIDSFPTDDFAVKVACEIKNFNPKDILGFKGLRNLDRTTLLLLASSKYAINDANLGITDNNTDDIGVCTGTTFSHLWSILEFDKEVFTDGIGFSNPALFPSNVMNAASSHVSIRFNIQGFNATISTGYTSGIEALKYSTNALKTGAANTVLVNGVDSLTYPVFFGFDRLGYMAGLKGIPLSCPFDKRRNGPILGEGSVSLCVESEETAKKRNASVLARIKGVSTYFDSSKNSNGLKIAIERLFDKTGMGPNDIDYISSSANSSYIDKKEVSALSNVFGKRLKNVPLSSIKSMFGETVSASSSLQIASCLGCMQTEMIPPTINYRDFDLDCDIDCVANKAQKKDVKTALVTSLGLGGYSAACILEKYQN